MEHTLRADRYDPLPPHLAERWSSFGRWDRVYFPTFVGLDIEEVRIDYARMRLPYRDELDQPAGVMHGGAIATLVDTVVVPAIAGPWEEPQMMLTLSMTVHYLGAIHKQDAIAEGWVERRGRSTVFCAAEVRSGDGSIAATGSLVYAIRPLKVADNT